MDGHCALAVVSHSKMSGCPGRRCRALLSAVSHVSFDDRKVKGKGIAHTRLPRVTVFRQTVHTHRASVHQAAKSVVALLRVAGVTAGLAESNGSLPPGL